MGRTPGVLLAVALTLALAACAPSTEAAPTPTTTGSAEPTRTPSPTPTPTPTETPVPLPTVTASASEWKTQLWDLGYTTVTAADETEPGRVEIQTELVDPGGADGSLEAQVAIEVCEAAVGLGATRVVVFEADGTSWILYGHPSYGNVCTEV